MRSQIAIVTVVLGGIVACSAHATDDGGCSTDSDCKGTRVCVQQECVEPTDGDDAGINPTIDSGKADSAPPKQDSGGGPTCGGAGTACSQTSDCCQTGGGIGSEGAVCLTDDGTCHAACTANSECNSGCCTMLEGQSYGVCAAGAGYGSACSTSAGCCQPVGSYGELCLSDDYECHAVCYASSECNSGCCIGLQGESYGACGTPVGHTCK